MPRTKTFTVRCVEPATAGKLTPAKFLKLLRSSDPTFMTDLFTNGGCFHLYRILSAIWPEAEAWYDAGEGHVYTKIRGRWYDIEGSHRSVTRVSRPMRRDDMNEARGWLKSRLEDHEGSVCDCDTRPHVGAGRPQGVTP